VADYSLSISMGSHMPRIHCIYLWLAISVTVNLRGMASLVEDIVVWADFFKYTIELRSIAPVTPGDGSHIFRNPCV